MPPQARLVPRKKVNGQDEDLFLGGVFTLEDDDKIHLCPPPPPQSRYSGAGPEATTKQMHAQD